MLTFPGVWFQGKKIPKTNEFLMVEFQASFTGWTYTPRSHAYIQSMMAWSMSKWDSVRMSVQGDPLDYSFQSIHVIQGDRASSSPAQNNLSFNNLIFIDPISTTFFNLRVLYLQCNSTPTWEGWINWNLLIKRRVTGNMCCAPYLKAPCST